jgi:hypothetical protein
VEQGKVPNTKMDHEVTGEQCSQCGKVVRGNFTVSDDKMGGNGMMIVIDSTPDRNYNICDGCNILICYECSIAPETGFCNECYKAYQDDGEAYHKDDNK